GTVRQTGDGAFDHPGDLITDLSAFAGRFGLESTRFQRTRHGWRKDDFPFHHPPAEQRYSTNPGSVDPKRGGRTAGRNSEKRGGERVRCKGGLGSGKDPI